MEGYIAEIRLFSATFAPRNWAYCNGQILAISTNTALFSLLGTTYGGNGQTTFALPDTRGRVVVGAGTRPNGPSFTPGEMWGTPTVTLLLSNLPTHNHPAAPIVMKAMNSAANNPSPAGTVFALPSGDINGDALTITTYHDGTGITTFGSLNPGAFSANLMPAGGTQPHSNMQPYLGMNYVICQYGIYPSRN